MNPQHVTGSGAAPTDSVGYPWSARYTIASGNLLADFRFNVTAESQGRLQVSRLYQLTDDPACAHAVLSPGARHHAPEPVPRRDQGAGGRGPGNDAVPEQLPAEARAPGGVVPVAELLRGRGEPAGPLGGGTLGRRPGRIEYVARPPAMGDVPELGAIDPCMQGTPKKPHKPSA
jgi:Mn-containing catalase